MMNIKLPTYLSVIFPCKGVIPVLCDTEMFSSMTACRNQVREPTLYPSAVCTHTQWLNLAVNKKGIIVETLELKMADAI